MHIVVALIPILIGAVCLYFDNRGTDPTHLFVYGVIVPIAVYLTVISELAIIWLFKHLREDDAVYVETYSNAVLFANKRASIVGAIDPKDIKHNIFSTSHCNLFARPEGENPLQIDTVARLNVSLFESLAKIALDPNSEGRIRVLLYARSQKDLDNEINQREWILANVSNKLGRQWDHDHFQFPMLVAKSLKDYLVIEDHVFKTVKSKCTTKIWNIAGLKLNTYIYKTKKSPIPTGTGYEICLKTAAGTDILANRYSTNPMIAAV